MKKVKFLWALIAVMSLAVFSSCKDDKNDPGDNGVTPGDGVSLVGTWKMVEITPADNEYVDKITFTSDGKVSGLFLEGDGEYSRFGGSYTLEGKNLTVYAVWQDEFDGDELEIWKAQIINLDKTTVTILIQWEDDWSQMLKFVRL